MTSSLKTIRVPNELYALILAKAKKQGVTINSVGVQAMWKGIDEA